MNAVRLKPLILGLTTFVVAHVVELRMWPAWFGQTAHARWFLNDGNAAVLFVVACVFVVSLVCAVVWTRSAREAFVSGANVGAGAAVAMFAVLVTLPGGPGTLFPIVAAIGALILIASAMLAASLVAAMKPRTERPR